MLEVRHGIFVLALEMNEVEIGLNLSADVADDKAYCILNLDVFLELGNCKLVDNYACVVWMLMAWGGGLPQISFDVLAAVEIFADVAPDILFYYKTTTWMSWNPTSNIKHKLI